MSIRVGINGFGRIGRMVFRMLRKQPEQFEVVAINNVPHNMVALTNLLRYDSVYGRFEETVVSGDGELIVGGQPIPLLCEPDPSLLPWGELGVDVVLEATGVFRTREDCADHLEAGARRVVLSAPARGPIDATVVLGVNDDVLRPEHRIVSNASCTTNCLAPIVKVLHESFGIERGLMTTVHAVTNDQRILDVVHKKDPRRGRAACFNIIPTTTGAAKAVAVVYPALEGRLSGIAMRVPIAVGSIVDLTVTLERDASVGAVNLAMQQAADGPLKGILAYNEDPVVSSDIIAMDPSSVFDATLTTASGPRFFKVCAWYDNEWGYSRRCVDLIRTLAELGPVPQSA